MNNEYELTANDHLMISMRGGLYDMEPPPPVTAEVYRDMFHRILNNLNDLEIGLQVTFTMTSNKLIDEHTGIAFAERNDNGKWVTIKGWQEALNNA